MGPLEPPAPVAPRGEFPLYDLAVAPREAEGPARSTVAAAMCLVLSSIGLLAAGAGWCLVGQRWMSAPGEPFWWGLDAIVWIFAGMAVLGIGATAVAAALLGFYTAVRLLQRAHRARNHALAVLIFAALVFFARSYSSPAIWVAGIAIGIGGAVLLLLPSSSADFE